MKIPVYFMADVSWSAITRYIHRKSIDKERNKLMKTNTIVKAVAGVFVIGGGLGYFTRLPGLFLSGHAILADLLGIWQTNTA